MVTKPIHLTRMLFILAALGGAIISMIVYGLNVGVRIAERYSPLIDATMEIKLEATTAYLIFETYLIEPNPPKIKDIQWHLDQTDWYLQAMMDGGINTEGDFKALEDQKLRQTVALVRQQLDVLSAYIFQRIQITSLPKNTRFKQQNFQDTFEQFLSNIDGVETKLQMRAKKSKQFFRLTQMLSAVVGFFLICTVGFIFTRFARNQQSGMKKLLHEIELRKQAEEILRHQATTDTLTGLYNRRYINDVLQNEMLRSKRQTNPFSVILFDIDHFKSINDSCGHDVGDHVLKEIARIMKANIREIDVLARWGGEEFLILLRDTNLTDAVKVSEKCRLALNNELITGPKTVAASFGVTQHKNDEAIRDMVHRADEALYAAKKNGRNQTISE